MMLVFSLSNNQKNYVLHNGLHENKGGDLMNTLILEINQKVVNSEYCQVCHKKIT